MQSNIIESVEEIMKNGTAKQLYIFIRTNWYNFTEEQREFITKHQLITNIIKSHLGFYNY